MIADEVNLDWVMIANSMTIYRHPKDLLDFMENFTKKEFQSSTPLFFMQDSLPAGTFRLCKNKAGFRGKQSQVRLEGKVFSPCVKNMT
jgi:hypothetical protein